jgi:hypothetical protein
MNRTTHAENAKEHIKERQRIELGGAGRHVPDQPFVAPSGQE